MLIFVIFFLLKKKIFTICYLFYNLFNYFFEKAAGYYIFDRDTYKSLAGAGAGLLFKCSETGTCIAVNQVGFYKNVDATITHTKCYMDTSGDEATLKCEGLTSPSDSCSGENVGKFDSSSGLCLNDSKTAAFVASGNPVQYLLSYGASSIFSTIIAENTYGVIKVTTDSMTLDTTVTSNKEVCADGDQKVTDLPESGSCAPSSTLYSLCTSGICQKICKVKTGVNCKFSISFILKNHKFFILFLFYFILFFLFFL